MVVFEEGIPARDPSPGTLHLFELGTEGALQPLAELAVPDVAGTMVFHPSGRFIYRLTAAALVVHAVGDDGRLSLVQTLPGDGATGADYLAITRVATGS
jgi:hypothetical protein